MGFISTSLKQQANFFSNCITTGKWRAAWQIRQAVKGADAPVVVKINRDGELSFKGSPREQASYSSYWYPTMQNLANIDGVRKLIVKPNATTSQIHNDIERLRPQLVSLNFPDVQPLYAEPTVLRDDFDVFKSVSIKPMKPKRPNAVNRLSWAARLAVPLTVIGLFTDNSFFGIFMFYGAITRLFSNPQMCGAWAARQSIEVIGKIQIIGEELWNTLWRIDDRL